MGLIENKVAIVTGGGQGLGEGICRRFAKEGASIAILGRTLSKIERVANDIKEEGGEAFPILCDITDRNQVDNAVQSVVDKYGTVDILINNAMTQKLVPFDNSTEEDLIDTFKSCVLVTYNMMISCFPYLKLQGGKVVNFGSAAGVEGRPNMITYGAAKEAVRGLTKGFAVEWGKFDININVVCPTALLQRGKPIVNRLRRGCKKALEPFLIKRMGDPETDIANIVLFLSCYMSDYMTGRTLFADGGRALYR